MTSEPATSTSRPTPAVRRRILLALVGLAFLGLAVIPLAIDGRRPAVNGPQVVWTFEQPQRGAIISTPAVNAEWLYVSAIRDNALDPSGVVYCLDRRRGTVSWTFDDGGTMRHTISSPCLADGRLYVGEGMHGNDVCKLYCLDAATGRKLWEFVTGGHIESSPCVAGGAVFFGSGDDGLYCLDAASGAKRWQFSGRWHIDSSPVVVDGRLYAGSGVSRLHRTTEIFCLDAADGRPLWRSPAELPVWGSPVVEGGQVFFGTGTGRLTRSAEAPEKPSGALLCAEAATGNMCWIAHVEDAVFGRPAVDAEHIYFGARDGRCCCLGRRDGRQRWQADLGSPIVTRPALAEGRLYVVACGGRVGCLDAANGRALWTFDVAKHTQTRPQLLSSPLLVRDEDDREPHNLLYFGTELRNDIRSAAVLYCLRD
jgi:outer membrane protein assembly factor BamB